MTQKRNKTITIILKPPKFKIGQAIEFQEKYGDGDSRAADRQYFCWIIFNNNLSHLFAKCCACGWKEGTIDLAHKSPKNQGGGYTIGNIVPLCPNCHRLFDDFKLSNNKARKINNFSKLMRCKFKEIKQKIG